MHLKKYIASCSKSLLIAVQYLGSTAGENIEDSGAFAVFFLGNSNTHTPPPQFPVASKCIDNILVCGHLVSEVQGFAHKAAAGHIRGQKLLLPATAHQLNLFHEQGILVWCQETPGWQREAHSLHSPLGALLTKSLLTLHPHIKNSSKLPNFQPHETLTCPMPKWFNICALKKESSRSWSVNIMKDMNDIAHQ